MSYVSDYFASHHWSWPSSGSTSTTTPVATTPTPAPPAVSTAPVAPVAAEPVAAEPVASGEEVQAPVTAPLATAAAPATAEASPPSGAISPNQPIEPSALVPNTYHHATAAGLATPNVSLLQLMNARGPHTSDVAPITAEMIAQSRGNAATAGNKATAAARTHAATIDGDTVSLGSLDGATANASVKTRAEVIAQAAYKVVARVGDMQADVLTLLKA